MKKILLFTAITIICSLISCSTDDEDFAASKARKVFTATIDQSVTRTTINTLDGKVTWNENDEITITDKDNKSAVYVCTEITDGVATFEPMTIGEEVESGPYTAVYGPFPFTEQTYTSTQGQLPMTAESSSTNLNFSVTCGLLGVKLQAANEGIKNIAVSNGTDTYTLTCIEPIGIETAQTFYIALPAGDYTSFIFTDHQGKSCPKTLKNGKTFSIKANQILSIQFTELTYWYVDLGLPSGTCWATFNVGANSPEEYGDYFAWGETKPYYIGDAQSGQPVWKEGMSEYGYYWQNYKYGDGNEPPVLSKYNIDSSRGTVDDKTVLDIEDDAANANWGGNWRMPTHLEQEELWTECTRTDTERNGIKGRLFTGKNGRSIFLPYAGYRAGTYLGNVGSWGGYLSSTLGSNPSRACYMSIQYSTLYEDYRCIGYSVRPVY